MRRNTLTPARSRMNSTVPSTPTGYFSQTPGLRRDLSRNPRDPHFMATSVEMINEYLQMSSGNEQIPLLTDRCPPYKHFQSIFKRIVSYFNPNMERTASGNISSFGEEAHSIIKSMKYPYSNELNKSHLTTTNPHSWPVISAFLRWLVEMVHLCEKSTLCTEKALTDGYRKFMEGEDNYYEQILRDKNGKENKINIRFMELLTTLNDMLHKEIKSEKISILNVINDVLSKIDSYSSSNKNTQAHLHHYIQAVLDDEKKLQLLIEKFSINNNLYDEQSQETSDGDTAFEQITDLSSEKVKGNLKERLNNSHHGQSIQNIIEFKNKLNDLLADKQSIQSNFSPLDQKEKRYLEQIKQLNIEIQNIDMGTPLKERDSLRNTMQEQKSKIKNIEQQTSLKNDLILQLEHIKKEKQNIYDKSNQIDTQISEKWDHHERYRHDLTTLLNNIVDTNRSSPRDNKIEYTRSLDTEFSNKINQACSEGNVLSYSELTLTKQYKNGLNLNDSLNPWVSEEAFLREINMLSDINIPKAPGNKPPGNKSIFKITPPEKENDNQGHRYKDIYLGETSQNNNEETFSDVNDCSFKDHLNDLIAQLEYTVTLSRENHAENVNGLNSLKNENISNNKRILNLSKVFLEKKKVFEKINIRTKNEMIKLENELLALSTSCGNNLLQSEQAVHYNSIKREKIDSFIQMEQTQIKMIVAKFYNEMVIEIESLRDLLNKK